MKRLLQLFVMMVTLFLVSGCGSTNIMDSYSFGQQIVNNGKSHVEITLPFEVGQARASSVAQKNGLFHPNTVYYQGQDQRFIVFITGSAIDTTKEVPTLANEAAQNIVAYENNQNISNVRLTPTPESLDGTPAMKITGTYMSGNILMGLVEYLFVDRGVLWRVQYMYNPKDKESVELVKYIDGKIKFIK